MLFPKINNEAHELTSPGLMDRAFFSVCFVCCRDLSQKNGVATLLLAGWFDPGMIAPARVLLGTTDRYPAWQAVVDELLR
jgi:hypothetical protein